MPLTAAGDTWGISGPVFLWGMYLPATIVVLIIVLRVRWMLKGGRELTRDPHPYEVAYLLGGHPRAVSASVGRLHAEGAIGVTKGGVLRVTGPKVDGTPLDDAVYEKVQARQDTLRQRELPYASEVYAAGKELADGLVRDGLLLGPRERRLGRVSVLPLALLWGLGLVRLVEGLANGKPVLFLVFTLVALGGVIAVLFGTSGNQLTRTRAGERVLEAARARHAHLNPGLSPAWATYGSVGAAFSVALFGTAALTSMDPEFMHYSDVQAFARGGGGSASGGGCGSGSSGCGGGGGGGCGGGGGGCGG